MSYVRVSSGIHTGVAPVWRRGCWSMALRPSGWRYERVSSRSRQSNILSESSAAAPMRLTAACSTSSALRSTSPKAPARGEDRSVAATAVEEERERSIEADAERGGPWILSCRCLRVSPSFFSRGGSAVPRLRGDAMRGCTKVPRKSTRSAEQLFRVREEERVRRCGRFKGRAAGGARGRAARRARYLPA
ncbi:hypothetical protein M885DRAFT_543604 [Pelagophyceae sp. CCMP2097]|nr:hypothetical protein M885DRAFT_543604 [Pelagophyceae sp. CCMP2097]